jgi:hypothetical protein
MRRALLVMAIGLAPAGGTAQQIMPSEAIVADTYTSAFPETGARIAVFDAGPGFREELFDRDLAGVFDTDRPGQPILVEADVIVARVPDWSAAIAVYDGTTLQEISDGIAAEAADTGPVYIRAAEMFGGARVLTFTFLSETAGTRTHARCMARMVVDVIYQGRDTAFDVVGCSSEMN